MKTTKKRLPKISIITPVLNESHRLPKCLNSIISQDYPKNKIEIIIADGGSSDNSIQIAKKYGARVISNKLKTSESGKAIAIKNAKADILVLLDGDNLLTDKKWLRKMGLSKEMGG